MKRIGSAFWGVVVLARTAGTGSSDGFTPNCPNGNANDRTRKGTGIMNGKTTMKKHGFAHGLFRAAACLLLSAGVARADAAAYEPAAWNVAARRAFAVRRFGIFIHWGLYANYAQGEWYLHDGKFGRHYDADKGRGLDEEAYSRMKDGFCPSKFDAREWVRVFKDAGAKYVTFTSRHHDGFSMWHTKADDGYNIANTPFGRDVVGELAAACREEGLQLNFYYSLIDWHRKDYPPGIDSDKVPLADRKPDCAAYKKFMLAQIGELIDGYGPGCIWFDGEWEHAEFKDGKWVRTLDWGFGEIYDFIHSKKVLTANNNHQPIRPKEDVQLFGRDLPGENSDGRLSARRRQGGRFDAAREDAVSSLPRSGEDGIHLQIAGRHRVGVPPRDRRSRPRDAHGGRRNARLDRAFRRRRVRHRCQAGSEMRRRPCDIIDARCRKKSA